MRASVVVIGGGVIGLSTAYNLARSGVEGVVLVERSELGSGSTCKAAGGVRAQFSDEVNIRLAARSLRILESFDEDFGQEINLHQVGYLFLLDQADHVAAFTKNVMLQNTLGVPSRMIAPEEAKALSPLIATDGLLAAAYCPSDGYCTPEAVVLGYATAARRCGARLLRNTEVVGIEQDENRLRAVHTSRGPVFTDSVICCAGAWSGAIGAMAGQTLPVTPLRRQIVVTEPTTELPRGSPFTIDFSSTFYFHGEGQGLLVGMSDPEEASGFLTGRSDAWLSQLAEVIERRAPRIADLGVASGWAGLYEVTPDNNGLIGESERLDRFLYCTGFSGHGFMMGPALGEVMAALYLGRAAGVDVSSLDVRRFEKPGVRPELNIV